MLQLQMPSPSTLALSPEAAPAICRQLGEKRLAIRVGASACVAITTIELFAVGSGVVPFRNSGISYRIADFRLGKRRLGIHLGIYVGRSE